MPVTKALAALTPKGDLVPHTIERRECGPDDVVIDIKFAGICHSDIHQVKSDWGPGIFPMVPGHEIGGFVSEVGSNVTNFAVGQTVGVGCIVDSCRSCTACQADSEQYCFSGMVGTYNSRYRYQHCREYNEETGGAPTYGGYSKNIVVDKKYVLAIPKNLDLAAATPLLCAGITTYSPLAHWGLKAGQRFGVAGLGGLGHMAAKFAKAMGAHTTVISRGHSKRESALVGLNADAFLDSTDVEAMKAANGTFDFIIDTIAADHDFGAFINLLGFDGKIVCVGAPAVEECPFYKVAPFPLLLKRKTVAGSLIGGIKETQEMLDFCGANNITCDIEMVSADKVGEAYVRTVKSDVKYRFVIDVDTI